MGIPKIIFSRESHHPPHPCISGEIRHHPSAQLVVLFVVVSSFSRVVAISPSTPCLLLDKFTAPEFRKIATFFSPPLLAPARAPSWPPALLRRRPPAEPSRRPPLDRDPTDPIHQNQARSEPSLVFCKRAPRFLENQTAVHIYSKEIPKQPKTFLLNP